MAGFAHRIATEADIPALAALMDRSISGPLAAFLNRLATAANLVSVRRMGANKHARDTKLGPPHGGVLSTMAALLHIACIIGGPDWYRFLGAGETMARMAEQGSITPSLITLGIAAVLAIWAAYAFSGAGLLPRLPLLRTGLVVISAIYLLRGLALIPALVINRGEVAPFVLWSSLIVLVYGLAYAVGTWAAWRDLGAPR